MKKIIVSAALSAVTVLGVVGFKSEGTSMVGATASTYQRSFKAGTNNAPLFTSITKLSCIAHHTQLSEEQLTAQVSVSDQVEMSTLD